VMLLSLLMACLPSLDPGTKHSGSGIWPREYHLNVHVYLFGVILKIGQECPKCVFKISAFETEHAE
jgi:hypothetical protein